MSGKIETLTKLRDAYYRWKRDKQTPVFLSAYELGIPNGNAKSLVKSGFLVHKYTEHPKRNGRIQYVSRYRISDKGLEYLNRHNF